MISRARLIHIYFTGLLTLIPINLLRAIIIVCIFGFTILLSLLWKYELILILITAMILEYYPFVRLVYTVISCRSFLWPIDPMHVIPKERPLHPIVVTLLSLWPLLKYGHLGRENRSLLNRICILVRQMSPIEGLVRSHETLFSERWLSFRDILIVSWRWIFSMFLERRWRLSSILFRKDWITSHFQVWNTRFVLILMLLLYLPAQLHRFTGQTHAIMILIVTFALLLLDHVLSSSQIIYFLLLVLSV